MSQGITITPYKTLVINTGFKYDSINTKINYFKKHKILNNNILSNLRFKEPILDKKILYKINLAYLKKNFLLISFNTFKENFYRIFF